MVARPVERLERHREVVGLVVRVNLGLLERERRVVLAARRRGRRTVEAGAQAAVRRHPGHRQNRADGVAVTRVHRKACRVGDVELDLDRRRVRGLEHLGAVRGALPEEHVEGLHSVVIDIREEAIRAHGADRDAEGGGGRRALHIAGLVSRL